MMSALWWTLCGALIAGGLVAAITATIGTTVPAGQGRIARWQAQWSGGPDAPRRGYGRLRAPGSRGPGDTWG